MIANHKTLRGAFQEGGLRRGGDATSGFFQQKKSVPFLECAEERSFVINNYLKIKNYKIKNFMGGQAALTAVIFFLFTSLIMTTGFVAFSASELKSSNLSLESKRSFAFAEGAMEDAIHRIKDGINMPSTVVYTDSDLSATTTVGGITDKTIEVASFSTTYRAFRKSRAVVMQGEGASFHYAVQIGEGGLEMASNSAVNGNVYTNGSIVGGGNSAINGDAYAVGTISSPNPDITGEKRTGVKSQPLVPVDTDYWKQEANRNNDPIIGNYEIGSGSQSLGPRKISGNLKINGNANLTLTGPLYITGNFEMNSNSDLYLDDSFGSLGTVIIVDGAAKLNSNTVVHPTNTTPKGYILILSTKSGGDAIELNSNSEAGIIYALNGEVEVNGNAKSVVVTGYRIKLDSNAVINYDSGLQDARFTGGPSGSWAINNWQEAP